MSAVCPAPFAASTLHRPRNSRSATLVSPLKTTPMSARCYDAFQLSVIGSKDQRREAAAVARVRPHPGVDQPVEKIDPALPRSVEVEFNDPLGGLCATIATKRSGAIVHAQFVEETHEREPRPEYRLRFGCLIVAEAIVLLKQRRSPMRALYRSPCKAAERRSARRLASVSVSALLFLFPLLAAAETANYAPAAPTSRDALLHHQPNEATVAQRQIQRYGRAEAERRQREMQSEIDRIYIDVMNRSALPTRQ
jgi:hypothetical protein